MKKSTNELATNERQMLELLSRGASSKEIAKRLGYREGTMRVYLHNLYRKLGVSNKTTAVIWYLDRARSAAAPIAANTPPTPAGEESFGEFAMRTSLLSALGMMSVFLGAYGRLWEVGNRLKGKAIDEAANAKRLRSRAIWEAYLGADFAHAKRLYDEDRVAEVLVDSPSDGVVLVAMLVAGGYTHAADRMLAQVSRRRRGGQGATPREHAFLLTLREAVEKGRDEALAALHQAASENAAAPGLRHLAMVSLYYARLALRDRARACATANALWAEAEKGRQQLHAMGERVLDRDATLPEPVKVGRDRIGAFLERLVPAR